MTAKKDKADAAQAATDAEIEAHVNRLNQLRFGPPRKIVGYKVKALWEGPGVEEFKFGIGDTIQVSDLQVPQVVPPPVLGPDYRIVKRSKIPTKEEFAANLCVWGNLEAIYEPLKDQPEPEPTPEPTPTEAG